MPLTYGVKDSKPDSSDAHRRFPLRAINRQRILSFFASPRNR